MKKALLITGLMASLILYVRQVKADPTWTFDSTTGTLTIGGDGIFGYTQGQEISQNYGNHAIKHVVFAQGSNITGIGGSAFQNQYALESVVLPSTVTSIAGYAFSGCYNLTDINITDRITHFGSEALYGVKGVTDIIVHPEASVHAAAFSNCPNLKEITLSPTQLSARGSARLYKSDFETACGSQPTLSEIVCAEARAYFDSHSGVDHYWYNGSVFGNSDLSHVLINCRGNISDCEAVMRYLNYGTGSGQKGAYNLVQKQPDGSTAIYRDGKLVGYKNKRIYTVQEANQVSKPTGNRVSLRYK